MNGNIDIVLCGFDAVLFYTTLLYGAKVTIMIESGEKHLLKLAEQYGTQENVNGKTTKMTYTLLNKGLRHLDKGFASG